MDSGVSPLISALCNPAVYPHPVDRVEVLETHISWIVLAGDYAYKIKKPVDFGFLNFTELTQRRFFCEEEIRLNARFESGLYLGVTPIGGSPEHPVLDGRPAFEYAVRMRRFAAPLLLDHCLQAGRLHPRHIDELAKRIAAFHEALPAAASQCDLGSAESVMRPARENVRQLGTLLDADALKTLADIADAGEREWQHCKRAIERRRVDGKIRECHGDLHLGNIVLVDDKPCPFDGIEFSEALRWIDVINDIAFLVMDLHHRNRPDLAYRFLNAYLEETGDYDGLVVLRFYLAYRAMVKAKVAALRAAQNGDKTLQDDCRRYMALAASVLRTRQPALIITFGLPGCGKTAVSQYMLERLPAVRVRSDVERKRLVGLAPTDRPNASHRLYVADVTEKTYGRLLSISEALLGNGYTVIVDAAFLRASERRRFMRLATQRDVPFVIFDIVSNEALQRRRLHQRRDDASDADETILDVLKRHAEPLDAAERQSAIRIDNDHEGIDQAISTAIWHRLQALTGRPEGFNVAFRDP